MAEINEQLEQKPILTYAGQLEHLQTKGIRFEKAYDEAAALTYLQNHSNFFRVYAYRKSFNIYHSGQNKGQYLNLDFNHLVDLSVIDYQLRGVLLGLTLDIEHYTKEKLLRLVLEAGEDGYAIVDDFLNASQVEARLRERAMSSLYCRDLYSKYGACMPVWVLFELLMFSELVDFATFCRYRYQRKDLQDLALLLKSAKSIRNATAHNSCLINDLRSKDDDQPAYGVSIKLGKIPGIGKEERRTKMKNPRIREIVTTLYLHSELVTSEGVHRHAAEELLRIKQRFGKRMDYTDQAIVGTSFSFLSKVIDAWFPLS